jgi:hypothetical protein
MDIQRACSSHLDRHQYIIFVKDEQFDDLLRWLNNLKQCLSLYNNEVLIQPQPCTNAQTLKIMENEGSIAGHDWRDYNEKRYIRVSLDKPKKKSGPLYKYHLVMANLLSSHCEALVGYKNRLGISNDDPNNPLWDVLIKDDNDKIKKVNFLPKHVSEPVSSILKALDKLEK